MSYLRITTVWPDGLDQVDVCEQTGVNAEDAFHRRIDRLKHTSQGHHIDREHMTIRLDPVGDTAYTQYLEYADNYEELRV